MSELVFPEMPTFEAVAAASINMPVKSSSNNSSIIFNTSPTGDNDFAHWRGRTPENTSAQEVQQFFTETIGKRPNGHISENQTEDGAIMLDFDFYQGRTLGNRIQIGYEHIRATVEAAIKLLVSMHELPESNMDIMTAVRRKAFVDGGLRLNKDAVRIEEIIQKILHDQICAMS